jgi:hypothetical protein
LRGSHWDLMSDETGQEALRLSAKFNNKVLLIRNHLNNDEHPLNRVAAMFDTLFSTGF